MKNKTNNIKGKEITHIRTKQKCKFPSKKVTTSKYHQADGFINKTCPHLMKIYSPTVASPRKLPQNKS